MVGTRNVIIFVDGSLASSLKLAVNRASARFARPIITKKKKERKDLQEVRSFRKRRIKIATRVDLCREVGHIDSGNALK